MRNERASQDKTEDVSPCIAGKTIRHMIVCPRLLRIAPGDINKSLQSYGRKAIKGLHFFYV